MNAWIQERRIDGPSGAGMAPFPGEVGWANMLEMVKTTGIPLMSLVHGGMVYDIGGQNICMANCLTIDPNEEELRQLIFFPDGHLRYDWQHKGAILL